MSQHTPGPWHKLNRNRVSRSGQPTFDIMAGSGGEENWEMVADRVDGEANACLIAAAPEMYDLLKTYVERWQSDSVIRETAIALLAKIEGNQP